MTAPDPPAELPAPDEPAITLDEWIAAGQACCGIEPDDDPPEQDQPEG